MKSALSACAFLLAASFFAVGTHGQTGPNTVGGGGGQSNGGFQGDGTLGGRVSGREGIQDNRSQTNTGENNITLGGGDNAGANNMGFLQSLFSAQAAGPNVNQTQSLRGRGIRAPLRLGFKFEGQSMEVALKKLNARIVRIPRFKDSRITAVIQQKTLHLIGEVASREEASLAERIAGFEPGVDQVKNLLKVVDSRN